VRLSAGSILVGKTPRTSGLLDYYDSLLLAVQRNDEYIDHTPDLEFAAGDVLWLVGDEKTLAQLK
jgi:Trk K+ transport system NAD-binding subunit